eukprot:CAMPEP_0175455450 /NCGR_PEP_ID=MMETSP0095-20121207/65020_1 /TAXON_ID=311494 /ORGANISM="Alexandrium monilatum, Strain CCMP3105" /LENGTH=570 /DNA_ID=CAMNT_0016756211 /DNA_START=28 /DNA_END=1740 /DNA_ORIENTATION=-
MAPQLQQGDKVGDYVIDSRIGKGRSGSVFLGRLADKLSEEVAVKYPANSRETTTLKKLDGCLGVPRLRSSGVHEETLWVAMELLGPPLTGVMHTLWMCSSIDQRWQGACLIGRMLLRRIVAIHNRGYVHGDIKPENVLIACKGGGGSAAEGRPVNQLFFVDFGLTREQTDTTALSGHIGTIEYSSINSMAGGARVRLDDVEALGWMLLHIMAGDMPWFEWIQGVDWNDKPARSELMQRVRQAKIDLLGAGPESFEARYGSLPPAIGEYLRVCSRAGGQDPAAKPDYHRLARLLGCWTITSEEDSREDIATFNKFYVGGNLALPTHAPNVGDTYFITSNWNKWSFEEMRRNPIMPDVYSAEVLLPRDGCEFRIVCNRDWSKVFHPAAKRAGQGDAKVVGPGKGAHGYNWAIGSKAGAVVEIEFQRAPDEALRAADAHLEPDHVLRAEGGLVVRMGPDGPVPAVPVLLGAQELVGDVGARALHVGVQLPAPVAVLQDLEALREPVPQLHPNVKRASPHVPHQLLGPEKDGHGRNWTIGAHPDDKASFGAQYVIRLQVGVGGAEGVDWKRLGG